MKSLINLYPAPKTCALAGDANTFSGDLASMEVPVRESKNLPDQGYRLIIGQNQVEIQANSEAAAFYAGQTLNQIIDQSDGAIPCLEVEDWPDIPIRGLMLDVSRCKVPTMDTLFDLVDWMASIKLNQLQLYIEHTFAFPGHEVVWEGASPITPDEIKKLDAYCQDRYIELVPNFNSFGHMERWLKHDPYRHLAECPDGFYSPDHREQFTHGTTLFPGPESAAFIASLYDDYLPLFKSRLFNVGGDEPWELGKGRSADQVAELGKGHVYLEFMKEIHAKVTERGHQMMCWADILMDHTEIIPEIPGDIIPIIWGYGAGHPFDHQCAVVAEHSKSYYVAPGNNTWNSLTCRLDEAIENMRNAARNAIKHGATGYLITTWGDNGNHQPWITQYPGILQGACSAWSLEQNENPDLAAYFDKFFFENSLLGKHLINMGRVENQLPLPFPNHPSWRSSTHSYLFLEAKDLVDRLKEEGSVPSESALRLFISDIKETLSQLSNIEATGKDAIALEEICLGLKMAEMGCRRAGAVFHQWEDTAWLDDLDSLKAEYGRVWSLRARRGGLEESLEYFDRSAVLSS